MAQLKSKATLKKGKIGPTGTSCHSIRRRTKFCSSSETTPCITTSWEAIEQLLPRDSSVVSKGLQVMVDTRPKKSQQYTRTVHTAKYNRPHLESHGQQGQASLFSLSGQRWWEHTWNTVASCGNPVQWGQREIGEGLSEGHQIGQGPQALDLWGEVAGILACFVNKVKRRIHSSLHWFERQLQM